MTKFMLLMNIDGGNCDTPMLEWDEAGHEGPHATT